MPSFGGPQRIAPRPVLEARREALLRDARGGRIRRVLAVRFARLGDVLFTTPALSLLAERLPGLRIDYLTGGAGAALVAGHPAVAEVLRFDPGWHRPGQLLGRLRLRRELERRGYDLALVFESDRPTRTWLERLCRAAGIPHVVSRSSALERRDLPPAEHSCEKHLRLLTMLGLEPDGRRYELHPTADDRARADALLARHGVALEAAERPLRIGLQAGSHYSRVPRWLLERVGLRHKFHKAWPYPYWTRLAQRLCDDLGARCVLTGAAWERRIAEGIARGVRAPRGLEPVVTAGETSVGELCGLLARLDLVVSIDTGTLHMAAALGVPALALFGPTNPGHHGPYGHPGRSLVLRSGVACSPCAKAVRRACRLNVCMSELSPERVFEAARELAGAAVRDSAPCA